MQLHDEGMVHSLQNITLRYGLFLLLLRTDFFLIEDFKSVVAGSSQPAALRVSLSQAQNGIRRALRFNLLLALLLWRFLSAKDLFSVFLRRLRLFLPEYLLHEGNFLRDFILLVLELAHVDTHDVLPGFQRLLVIPLSDHVHLSKRALPQPPHHLEVPNRLLLAASGPEFALLPRRKVVHVVRSQRKL
jgi:hypothetical protein